MNRATCLALAAIALLGITQPLIAAGGRLKLKTDGTPDGSYCALSGSGIDYFITEYTPADFDPGAIICGAKVREITYGDPTGRRFQCELRREDGLFPGYPDLAPAGLIARADFDADCRQAGRLPGAIIPPAREFTFDAGRGVPYPGGKLYLCLREPVHGPGSLDFCGILLDTDGDEDSTKYKGFSKVFDFGLFFVTPNGWNHFAELIVFEPRPVDLNMRVSSSSPFPGALGRKILPTRVPNSSGSISDQNLTVTLSIENDTGVPIESEIRVSAKVRNRTYSVERYMRSVGGGPFPRQPTLYVGRIILRGETSAEFVKRKIDEVTVGFVGAGLWEALVWVFNAAVRRRPLLGDDVLDEEEDILGVRGMIGNSDDYLVDSYQFTQSPIQTGDSLNARFQAKDLPLTTSYTVTGLELVGGEFGGSGLSGLDAVELRLEDPIVSGSPDLSAAGLVSGAGIEDGVGEVSIGPPPTTATLNIRDVAFNPTAPSGLVPNLFIRAALLPGDFGGGSLGTAVGADTDPGPTLLGDSCFTLSGVQPSTYDPYSNYMLRLKIDGAGGTLAEDDHRLPGVPRPNATSRAIGELIGLDSRGNRIH